MHSRSFWSSIKLRVFLENVVSARLRGVLEPEHGLGIEQVVFAVAPPLVLAPFQQRARHGASRLENAR